ncbi:hypothetical protein F0H41_00805 [Vibrio cholerae]|nr:hypothetical protein [Vibrio cholerae]EGR0805479.1 hypothetical protein [Vibrio cholerae]EGR0810078.1 hypothetical protein [Vibrio cholerae]EGR0873519.1 hypothetical protein [Vibrio cholerae]EGR1448983.1 hypothetical protein [Vibrio cholerae]
MKRRRVEQQKASNSVSYAVCCTLFSTDYSLICQKLNGKEQNATSSALAAVNYSSDCQSQQSAFQCSANYLREITKNQQSNLLLNKDKVIEILDLEHPWNQIR